MKKWTKSFLLVLIVSTWLFSPVFPQETPVENPSPYAGVISEFEKYVYKQMKIDKIPGLTIGFLKGDHIWAHGYGYSDLENMVPAHAESAYRLASITKTITAIAVLQLAEAGRINLDKEVQAYVPHFPRKKWPVTVRQLLGHLGGISHYRDYSKESHFKQHMNTRQALAVFQHFDLVAEPGTKYNYSSYGYNLLGAVIERASGLSYASYISRSILNPLGMSSTRLDSPIDLIPHRVRGYRLINGEVKNSEFVDISSRFAGGGTRSTVIDLLKYAQGICAGKLLKPETWRLMFTSMATRAKHFTGYGMGWRINPWQGHFQVSHGGSQPETRTYFLLFPSEKFAIAIGANLEGTNLMPYVTRLAELVLDQDLDIYAYSNDPVEQTLYNACSSIFNYGMSQYVHWGRAIPATLTEKELSKAFAFFNKHMHMRSKSSKTSLPKLKKTLIEGFHPAQDIALIKVGAYMASELEKNFGNDQLHQYHQTGPLEFFADYIKANQGKFQINSGLEKLIAKWREDWGKTYTDYIRHLQINPETNFIELGSALKQTIANSHFYPDLSQKMLTVADYFLQKDDLHNTLKILHLGEDLYPLHSAIYRAQASAHIWNGDKEGALRLYRKAWAIEPFSPNQLERLTVRLQMKRKIPELLLLTEIMVDLFPQDVQLVINIANLLLKLGKKEVAVKYYQKALELEPRLPEVKKILQKLRTKREV